MGGAGPRGSAQSCVAVLLGDKFFIVDTGARSADKRGSLALAASTPRCGFADPFPFRPYCRFGGYAFKQLGARAPVQA